MSLLFTKMVVTYGLLNASFNSFKILRRLQKTRKLLRDPNINTNNFTRYDAKQVMEVLDRREVIPLIQFWTVLAVLQWYSIYLEPLVSWFPFYFVGKLMVLIYLITPQTKGAVVAFDTIVGPEMKRRANQWNHTIMPSLRKWTLYISSLMRKYITRREILRSVSDEELREMESHVAWLMREMEREGYRRMEEDEDYRFMEEDAEVRARRNRVMELLSQIEDEQQRQALMKDILVEYDSDDELWTELRFDENQLLLDDKTHQQDQDDDEAVRLGENDIDHLF